MLQEENTSAPSKSEYFRTCSDSVSKSIHKRSAVKSFSSLRSIGYSAHKKPAVDIKFRPVRLLPNDLYSDSDLEEENEASTNEKPTVEIKESLTEQLNTSFIEEKSEKGCKQIELLKESAILNNNLKNDSLLTGILCLETPVKSKVEKYNNLDCKVNDSEPYSEIKKQNSILSLIKNKQIAKVQGDSSYSSSFDSGKFFVNDSIFINRQRSTTKKTDQNKNECIGSIVKRENIKSYTTPCKEIVQIDFLSASKNINAGSKHQRTFEAIDEDGGKENKLELIECVSDTFKFVRPTEKSGNNNKEKLTENGAIKTEYPEPTNQHSKHENIQFSIPASLPDNKQLQNIIVKGKIYTVFNKLGEGGSSEVYQVFDNETSQLRAIKCVNLDVDQATATGYLNEINMLSQLQGSDRVVQMFDYEHLVEQKQLFVVMEKGDIDLSKLLRNAAETSNSNLPLLMILYYWTEMLTAVKYIHDHGIIHSDLKPGNFLLVMGRLKLIDFGIASIVQDDVTSVIKNTQTGTFNYISPEALMDSRTSQSNSPLGNTPKIKISFKSDVWSLGCILYNLIYRRTPFQHITHPWGKMRALTDPNHQISFPPAPHCSAILIETLKKCLRYEMRSRPSVTELLEIPYIAQ